ncbi:ATP-binding protein [Streptomyces avermitilis]|uniref:ATP-binding protein n=1 Tax=Streptomyces avermitilis TaxID=33903 RepID=UPI0037F2A22E
MSTKNGTNQARTSHDVGSELIYLTKALKAPALRDAAARLAERARDEGWSHEEYLAACLQREVAARDSHGAEGRIRAARFPSRKSLEDFDFDHQRSVKREVIAHLGTLDFVAGKENVIFLGPPGTGKTHLATGLGIRACQAGHRVAFGTAAQWVTRLAEAHQAGRLSDELTRLGRGQRARWRSGWPAAHRPQQRGVEDPRRVYIWPDGEVLPQNWDTQEFTVKHLQAYAARCARISAELAAGPRDGIR